jgi:hypothetical protein
MNVVAFVIALAIFLFGFWLFGLAFTVTVFQLPIFLAGIIAVSLAVAVPVHILRD